MTLKKSTNVDFQRAKYLILNFCRDVKKISWPKEVKIAKQLLKKYPNFDSWVGISMGEKPVSLSWFLTDEGKQFISIAEKKQKLDLDTKKTYSIQEEKIGEDRKITKKTKSIKDFLKGDNYA